MCEPFMTVESPGRKVFRPGLFCGGDPPGFQYAPQGATFFGDGGMWLRLRRLSHLIPALPRPGGEGGHAGEGGAREEGLCTTTPSTLQSPAGDSSPYEGEPKRTRLRLRRGLRIPWPLPGGGADRAAGTRGNLNQRREAKPFWGYTDSPQSRCARQLPSERGAFFCLRAGRECGRVWNPPLRGYTVVFA